MRNKNSSNDKNVGNLFSLFFFLNFVEEKKKHSKSLCMVSFDFIKKKKSSAELNGNLKGYKKKT